MRNVAKRMLKGEIAERVILWAQNRRDDLAAIAARERGERIMKRVGGRWMNRDASDKFREWCAKFSADKQKARAEAIMKRVGGRMRNKEVALNWYEWVRNANSDRESMWQNRVKRIQQQMQDTIDELNMKFRMVTQVILLLPSFSASLCLVLPVLLF